MQEHALPQDVTGYKFHIIGNMTLKQFGEVAAGCIVGFLLYQTNLYQFIKIPLIVLAGASGAMVAFVPIEERPLDQWITAFFRALYRPTQYYWKRMVKIPEPFLYQPKTEMKTVVEDVDLTPARRQRVKDYLRSIDKETEVADQFDQYTEQRMTEVLGEFGGTAKPSFAFAQVADTTGQAVTEEEAMLTASPDSVSAAVDNLSFAGRGATEEPVVVDEGPSAQEVEMSENVLRLFDNDQPLTSQPDVIPQPEALPPLPEPVPEPTPEPIPPAPEPDTIPAAVTISTPQPEPPKPVVPEPLPPAPKPEPLPPAPKPEPLPPAPEPEPEPEPLPPPPVKAAPKVVPQDMKELPEVSLTPEEAPAEPPPAELPQISTVFDTPQTSAVAESIPKVDTERYNKYSLSSHPANVDADSSQVAQIADVISRSGPPSQRKKTSVQFKTRRTATNDKFETVLPHILDMTGTASEVTVAPAPAVEEVKPLPNVNKEVIVPELEDIRVERTMKEEEADKSKSTNEVSTAVDPSLLQLPENKKTVESSGGVTFNANLPFPEKPTKPNRVVGMVIDQSNNSLPNAIVEILSPEGVTARAVRTNPLGQFFIATPLNPGEYLITADREGFTFPTQQLSVTNKIIDPIEIRANENQRINA